jgi:sigma-B regulation protein RsbU (phosphoserine phosphatase)
MHESTSLEALSQPSAGSGLDKAPSGRILVVDDDAVNRTMLGATLRKAGFEVLNASSGSEALAITAAAAPDLVLLDYMMPEMSGPEVLTRMRSQARMAGVPIFMVTASALGEHIESGLEAGADDYLLKPIDPRILRTRVTSALRAVADRHRADAAAAVGLRHDALVAELAEARHVQRAQIPTSPVRWAGWRATGAVMPSGAVGGDVYDLVEGRAGRRVAVLVDVCGHGVGAALVAASIQSELRALLRDHPLTAAFALLNEQLVAQSSPRYACIAAVELGLGEVTVVNAGLPPVCTGRAGKIRATVQATGVPPGMFAGERYESLTIAVAPGDRIALMSDGLTEPFGNADDVDAAAEALGFFDPARWQEGDPVPAEEHLRRWMAEATTEIRDDATFLLLCSEG